MRTDPIIAAITVGAACASACFHPTFDDPTCGPRGECPGGYACNAIGICKPGVVGPGLDAASLDAASLDGAGLDGAIGAGDCLARWLNGTVAFAVPRELASLSSAGNEGGPWISGDRLTLYFTSGANEPAIYRASRASVGLDFGTVQLISSVGLDSGPSLTADETALVFSSVRPSTTYDSEIYIAVRSDPQTEFGSADKKHLGNLNSSVQNLVDPFFAADGRKLYLAYNPVVGSGLLRIGLTTRADTVSDFGPPIAVPVISALDAVNRAPAVSKDERIIVFSSDRSGGSGGTDLWYATRPDAAHDFGAPALIPGVNSPASDDDPMLSADGCELYFSSSRNGDNYDLYVAQIAS
ncbi:MAG: hypothetical protein ACREBE_12975 [bacterium]